MKISKLLPSLALVTAVIIASCGKLEDRINSLEQRISELEDTRIPSIDEQVASIKKTIGELEKTDAGLREYISALEDKQTKLEAELGKTNAALTEAQKTLREEMAADKSELSGEVDAAKAEVIAQLEAYKTLMNGELETLNGTIEELKAKDAELQKNAEELRSYVDSENGKVRDWADATFATIEQQNKLAETVAGIKTQLETLNTYTMNMDVRLTNKAEELSKSLTALDESTGQQIGTLTDKLGSDISALRTELTDAYTKLVATEITKLETSMKSWVSEQLSGYCTIEQTDAKLDAMKTELVGRMDSDKAYLTTLITNLETATNKKISANASLITGLRGDLTSLSQSVAENAGKIADDAILISQNTSAISKNGAAIAANTKDLATVKKLAEENQKFIAENSEKLDEMVRLHNTLKDSGIEDCVETVLQNTKDIASNASLIAKNAEAIRSNAAAIAQNVSDIQALQEKLDTTRTEIVEAYTAAIAKAISDYDGTITTGIASEIAKLNTRIDSYAEDTNRKIQEIQDIVSGMREQVTSLLSRIQSVSFVPRFMDGNATMKKIQGVDEGMAELDYKIMPAYLAVDIAEHWKDIISVNAVYTDTRPATKALTFENLPIISCTASSEGLLSLKVSGENLSDDYFHRIVHANASLTICDGSNMISTDYVKICALYYSDHTLLYTNGKLTVSKMSTSGISDPIISNTFEDGFGMLVYAHPIVDCKILSNAPSEILAFPTTTESITIRDTYIKSVVLPESMHEVNEDAFLNCTNLDEVIFHEGITTIGTRAFYMCPLKKLKSLPQSIRAIGNAAFYNISPSDHFIIPEGVYTIGEAAFSNLKTPILSIPSTLANIGKEAFSFMQVEDRLFINCNIPGISSYGDCGLFRNSLFGDVVIGEKVKKIGSGAFYDSGTTSSKDGIEHKLYVRANIPPIIEDGALSLKNGGNFAEPYVPINHIETYKAATGWNNAISYDFEADPNHILSF